MALRSWPPPQPISVTFTAKEGAAVHALLHGFVVNRSAVEDVMPDRAPDFDALERAAAALERKLTAAGCVLTDDGWHA